MRAAAVPIGSRGAQRDSRRSIRCRSTCAEAADGRSELIRSVRDGEPDPAAEGGLVVRVFDHRAEFWRYGAKAGLVDVDQRAGDALLDTPLDALLDTPCSMPRSMPSWIPSRRQVSTMSWVSMSNSWSSVQSSRFRRVAEVKRASAKLRSAPARTQTQITEVPRTGPLKLPLRLPRRSRSRPRHGRHRRRSPPPGSAWDRQAWRRDAGQRWGPPCCPCASYSRRAASR